MRLNLKQRIAGGISFLTFLLLLTGGGGIYYLAQLRNAARVILKDNYDSLRYAHGMQRQLNAMSIQSEQALFRFDSLLQRQENNITEAGEREVTSAIRTIFDNLASGRTGDRSQVDSIQTAIQLILDLNMAAIDRKNEQTEGIADRALVYISLSASLIFLIALVFLSYFPSYIAGPIGKLTEGIRAIAERHYNQQIHIDSQDELGEMAKAFNAMANKLNEYEHSNLAQLMFEKSRAEAVINSIRDASFGVDSDGRVLFVNEQGLQLLNLSISEIVGASADSIAAINDLFRFIIDNNQQSAFKIVVEGKENFFIREINHIKRDDTELGTVYTLKNITAFQEKDIAKTNFFATISHELKTPLASTGIGLSLLESPKTGQLTNAQRDIILDLKKDNQRLIKLVGELLNIAQAETGNINLSIGNITLGEVINYAIDTVKNQAAEKAIEITVDIPANLPDVKADKEKAAWVLVNLLSNAIRYSPAKERVDIKVNPCGDNHICCSISDKGPGIPPAYQDKIFQRFFTVPGSNPGNGLGLAISKEFMEAMGGEVKLKKSSDKGTEFELSFKSGPHS